ncbi:hypothetical protein RKE25_22115 (plasmid) [Dyella sp. BiH032]|uniref:hypothetical protein n=1 Tax=Dyella sp. BiH032 TaxID=3075430 RepID=UPI0028934114|nr:hypothetical protein [Dyella sp. BiH032]WNL48427.1 hypothetical protein RKE25_22115 [Dyella sp. BiH032]
MRLKLIAWVLFAAGAVGMGAIAYHQDRPTYTFDNLDDWVHGALIGKRAFDQGLPVKIAALNDGAASVDFGDLDQTRCRAALKVWTDQPSRVDAVQVDGLGKRTPIASAGDMCRSKTNRVTLHLTREEFAKVQARDIITHEMAEASK